MTMDHDDWLWSMTALLQEFDAAHPFGRATIEIGENVFNAAVATTVEQRIRGMQGRRFSSFDCMLFVFPTEQVVNFHNHKVQEPIDVVFYDADGEMVSANRMEADGRGILSSGQPVKYAVEFPAGELEEYGRFHDARTPVGLMLTAQERKQPPEAVNLRPAEPNAPESCATCEFFLGGNGCELVTETKPTYICQEYTMDDDFRSETEDGKNMELMPPGTTP